MKTYTITFMPEGKTALFEENTLILDILNDYGVDISSPCGGKGICGKCIVEAEGSLTEKTDLEKKFTGKDENLRLSCQARISGDITINTALPAADKEPSVSLQPDTNTAIAVDMGTTSIQISLLDIDKKKQILKKNALNPQRRFGHDVISRISASSDEITFKKNTHLLRREIQTLIDTIQKKTGFNPERCHKIALSGNTTMIHFLLGLDVSPIGISPYDTPYLNYDKATLESINLDMQKNTRTIIHPAVSAYLGGDLLGGMAFADMMDFKENSFFIDIGTNGELFLRTGKNSIYAASCAMGPALEGMNMSCGMTAQAGAINHFSLDNKIRYSVIGKGSPLGISGTGIIDLIAILLETGLLLPSGAFNKADIEEKAASIGFFFNVEKKQLHITTDIYISQKDIRNVQLAKGASLAASNMLIESSGTNPENIKNVIIAGAFGEHLDLDSFKKLKFLPSFKKSQYHFLGNTSLKSAEQSCYSDSFINRMKELKQQIKVIDLNSNPGFNDLFIESLNF